MYPSRIQCDRLSRMEFWSNLISPGSIPIIHPAAKRMAMAPQSTFPSCVWTLVYSSGKPAGKLRASLIVSGLVFSPCRGSATISVPGSVVDTQIQWFGFMWMIWTPGSRSMVLLVWVGRGRFPWFCLVPCLLLSSVITSLIVVSVIIVPLVMLVAASVLGSLFSGCGAFRLLCGCVCLPGG